MSTFLNDTPFVLSFMGLAIVIQLFMGDKITQWFLMLVLFGMIVTNADKFTKLINRGFQTNG